MEVAVCEDDAALQEGVRRTPSQPLHAAAAVRPGTSKVRRREGFGGKMQVLQLLTLAVAGT
jgi:hypothetical protein